MLHENLKHYFTTGEFAKICQVNKRTLFHYHDIGLFSPAFTGENGYRYYSYQQFDVFAIIATLKKLNVPLRDIKTYLDRRTPEAMLELSRQKISEVEQEIEKLNQIRHILTETIDYTNRGLAADYDHIFVQEQAEEYIILSNRLSEENNKDYISWMLEYTSFMDSTESIETSFIGSMVSKESIVKRDFYRTAYLFAKTTARHTGDSAAIKPKGLYAIAYHQGSYTSLNAAYERLLRFLDRNHLAVGGFAYEEYLIDEVGAKDTNDYITQITLAVERA
jgi:DNA-binding transcriptional MerR regulator